MKKTLCCALALALGAVAPACGEDDDKDSNADDDADDGNDGNDGSTDDDDADGEPDDGDAMMDASTPDEDAGDEGTDDEGEPDQSTCEPMFPDAGAMCNTLESTATAVSIAAAAGEAPVGTGGTITAGHYTLTAVKAYSGSALPVGVNIAQDAEICGGVMQIVQVIAGNYKRVTTSLAPDGSDPHLMETCSTTDPDDTVWSSYTSEGGTFTLYSAAGKMALTYTKQ